MAEEQGAQPIEEAAGAPNGTEPTETERDWKAEYEKLLRHSRTWEDKAKRLKEKADRYDELEEASTTCRSTSSRRLQSGEPGPEPGTPQGIIRALNAYNLNGPELEPASSTWASRGTRTASSTAAAPGA